MYFKKLSCCVLVSAALSASMPSWAEITDGLFFFDGNLPKNIVADEGSLTIDSLHYKDGQSALRWQFKPHEKIVFNTPVHLNPDNQITPDTFLVWIYNEKPSKEYLSFQFGQKDHPDTRQFKASLDFSGWRGIAVPYRDMDGKAVKDIDTLTITAPDYSGELYLDQMMVNVPVDNRWPTPDYIVPFINHEVNTMVSKNWTALLMYDEMLAKQYPSLDFSVAFDDTTGDTKPLYQKAELHLGIKTDAPAPSVKDVEKNLQAYKKFNIKENDQGVITGPPLEYPARKHYMKAKGVFTKEVQKHLMENVNDLRTIGKTLLQTAKYLHHPKLDEKLRTRLEKQFLLTTRYILDQGFVGGSGYQIITHVGYQSREVFDAWFLERHLLAAHHLLQPAQQAMMWFNATGRIFEKDDEIVDADVDILNTQLQWMIKSILMLPNQQQRESLLKQLSGWLSKTIQRSKGVAGGFKADGSVFHHSQHYTAYAKDAFGGLAPSVYILSETPYALDKGAQKRLSDSLYKMWVYTKDSYIPVVLSGRHPTGIFTIASDPFKWLALAGDPEHPGQINAPLAGVYARLTGKDDFKGVKAAAEPVGAWAMNDAAMAIQRRASTKDPEKSWLAIARGFSRYLVGNESYEHNNRYSRYSQYGNLEIIPADYSQKAFSHSGWDWNRYPGTTSIHLPFNALKSNLIQLPDAGIEEMLLSTETYVGANELNNNSMFAMKLHGHSKYHQESFKARKSYFMFDNRIIALGSGIENDDAEHVTETTVFQYAVPTLKPIQIDGKALNKPGTHQQIRRALTLKDPAGNDYFIPDGYDVDIYYQHQQSPDDRNDQPTEGNFATAVINHGKAPKKAGYEYAIVIDGGDKPQTKPVYRVLHKDDNLHAVRDNISAQEDYAYFESYDQDVGGIVLASDAPALVMAAPKDKQLLLSVVNPDLAFYQGVEEDQVDADGKQVEVSIYSRKWRTNDSQPQTSAITLKGQWDVAEKSTCAKVTPAGQTTVVKVTTTQATPCRIQLHQQ